MTSRKIIHCDCDCFYAAVEMRDDPSLAAKPVAVGGRAESRGVIAASNYPARAYGVRSAMPTAHALRLCPQLVLLPPDFVRYRAASRQILAIYRDYTPLVEPLSLDEAYLDVTGVDRCAGSATRMAEQIRARVRAEVGLTVSAGVAPNKFIAKIASDWNKPDGLFVVAPEAVDAFVVALPVSRLFGVGKVTAARLEALGVHTCGELRAFDQLTLVRHFGRFGVALYRMCRGEDRRAVQPNRIRKSLSVEATFADDLADVATCQAALAALLDELTVRRTRTLEPGPVHKLFVKARFDDFSHTTVECVAEEPWALRWDSLLREAFGRRQRPVRLLGVGVRYLPPQAGAGVQLDMFESAES